MTKTCTSFNRQKDKFPGPPVNLILGNLIFRLGPKVGSRSVTGIYVLARGLKPRKQNSLSLSIGLIYLPIH